MFCLKIMGDNRRPTVVVFIVWSALIIGGWVLVGWCRKSYSVPAEISSLCVPGLIRGLGCKVSLKFNLVVSDVDPGNEDFMCKSVGANKFFCFVNLN